MRVPRFYMSPISDANEVIINNLHHFKHITKVLRMDVGSELELFDGLGGKARVRINSFYKNKIECKVILKEIVSRSSEIGISAIVPVIKKETFTIMVQKLVEIGIDKIYIYRSELEDQTVRKKKNFAWDNYAQDIACRACEQSGNNFLPTCKIQPGLEKAIENFQGNFQEYTLIYLDPSAEKLIYDFEKKSFAGLVIISGPESGFSENEKNILQSKDLMSVSLGNNILRAETAPIVAAFTLMR